MEQVCTAGVRVHTPLVAQDGAPLVCEVIGVGSTRKQLINQLLALRRIRVGKELLRLARVFDLKLLAADPYAETLELSYIGARHVPLEQLMREADFVVVACLLNEETRALVGARQLALMKPGAYFINVARGPIVDEKALYEALAARRIAGAGLDVFENEPPVDNPLLTLDNVVFTAHTAGVDVQSRDDMARAAAQAIACVLAGNWPEGWVVNPQVRK